MDEIGRGEYLVSFPHDKTLTSIRRAALKEARENRKLEIDLYWKRAAYFWAFIAAAFAGYFLLPKTLEDQTVSYVTACLGFIFSLAWYFVNRGSKYWQQNWEMHVDLLEDEIAGPVYKTVVQPRQYSFCIVDGPYPFSVSKINQLLSLFVTIVWLVLMARTIAIVLNVKSPLPHLSIIAMSTVTLGTVIMLACMGRTENRQDDVQLETVYQRKRTYK
jgi:hypothetical protein